MKYIVTGANGFIGSYLADFFLREGHDVIGISRKFFPKIRERLSKAELIEMDIMSDEYKNLKVSADVIIHLAASNDIISRNVSKGIELSTVGTINTLNLAVRNSIPGFVFYSTLQVLGSELSGNYMQNSPVKADNDYALNHVFGELYVEMFSRKFGLKTVNIRPSNIYGKFLSTEIDRWTLVPGCFIKEAIEKGTITLLSSGKQYRNFISMEELSYITDCVAQNLKANHNNIIVSSEKYCSIFDVALLTKNILMDTFNMDISLHIMSPLPKSGNVFKVDRTHLESYGVDVNKDYTNTMKTEIIQIVSDLLSINK
jgi:UDP-glucose 4-epimerase